MAAMNELFAAAGTLDSCAVVYALDDILVFSPSWLSALQPPNFAYTFTTLQWTHISFTWTEVRRAAYGRGGEKERRQQQYPCPGGNGCERGRWHLR